MARKYRIFPSESFLVASSLLVIQPCLLRPLLHFRVVVIKHGEPLFSIHLLHRLLEDNLDVDRVWSLSLRFRRNTRQPSERRERRSISVD